MEYHPRWDTRALSIPLHSTHGHISRTQHMVVLTTSFDCALRRGETCSRIPLISVVLPCLVNVVRATLILTLN